MSKPRYERCQTGLCRTSYAVSERNGKQPEIIVVLQSTSLVSQFCFESVIVDIVSSTAAIVFLFFWCNII